MVLYPMRIDTSTPQFQNLESYLCHGELYAGHCYSGVGAKKKLGGKQSGHMRSSH